MNFNDYFVAEFSNDLFLGFAIIRDYVARNLLNYPKWSGFWIVLG
jgi:hypothetical protein